MIEASIGKKTTEFWLILATGLFMIVNGTEWIEVDSEYVRMWFAVVGAYTGLRTWEKRTAITANVDKKESFDRVPVI